MCKHYESRPGNPVLVWHCTKLRQSWAAYLQKRFGLRVQKYHGSSIDHAKNVLLKNKRLLPIIQAKDPVKRSRISVTLPAPVINELLSRPDVTISDLIIAKRVTIVALCAARPSDGGTSTMKAKRLRTNVRDTKTNESFQGHDQYFFHFYVMFHIGKATVRIVRLTCLQVGPNTD